MKRFKNILLVLREDQNRSGIERAVALAQKNDAKLTLIQAPGQFARGVELLKGMASFGRLQATILEKKQEELDALCDSFDVREAVGVVASVGTPSVAIVKQVLRERHDLVITTAQGSSTSAGGLFRSLSLHLIRKCPCPVWVVHPEIRRTGGQVMAAVDPDPLESHGSVNSLIMDLAVSLAELDGAKLHIAHAYHMLELEGSEDLRREHGLKIPKDLYQECVDSAVKERRRKLDELLEGYALDALEHQIHFEAGHPSFLVPSLAKREQVDVLILGAITHGDSAGHCIGMTAEDIIHQIGCSVLAVKPPEFVSPISE
jgi:universal stress protein E